jgi:hypothetical protein
MNPKTTGRFFVAIWIVGIIVVLGGNGLLMYLQLFTYDETCVVGTCKSELEFKSGNKDSCSYKFFFDKDRFILNHCETDLDICHTDKLQRCILNLAVSSNCPVNNCKQVNFPIYMSVLVGISLIFLLFSAKTLLMINKHYLNKNPVYSWNNELMKDDYEDVNEL